MRKVITIIAVILFFTCSYAHDTRPYVPKPDGAKGVVFYYKNIGGNTLYSDGKKVTDDFDVSGNLLIIRPIYYFNIFGKTATLQAFIPVGEKSIKGAAVGGKKYESKGVADITVIGGVWSVNKPEQQLWIGHSIYLTLPVGDYDNSNITAANLGENRYKVKLELGAEKGFGQFQISGAASIDIYGDNDEYNPYKANLEQKNGYNAETHFSYVTTNRFIYSLDYYYEGGAETKENGVENSDKLSTHSLQGEIGYIITPKYTLFLHYMKDIDVKNGPKLDTITLSYGHIF